MDYLEDETVSLDDRGKPWLDIASACGFDLDVDPKTVARWMRKDQDTGNYKCEEEIELSESQAGVQLSFTFKYISIPSELRRAREYSEF
jgi:hypothetical protein